MTWIRQFVTLRAKKTKHNRVNCLHHCIYSTNIHIISKPFYFSKRISLQNVKTKYIYVKLRSKFYDKSDYVFLIFTCPCIVHIIPNYSEQEATFLDLLISTDALHVSGGSSAHHQEHINVHTASGIVIQYCCLLVSWMRWNSSPSHPR